MLGILFKLILAAVLGGVLGLERESKHKPLGLKTCIVISVASAVLTIVSIEISMTSFSSSLVRSDPMRLAAQVVSGVGFLGAGVILRKSNDAISGLTTAAIVWAASGLGIAVGAGYYFDAITGVALIFLGVKVLPYLLRKVGPRSLREQGIKMIVYVNQLSDIHLVINDIRSLDIRIMDVSITGNKEGHCLNLHCTVIDEKDFILKYYNQVSKVEGVTHLAIEEV